MIREATQNQKETLIRMGIVSPNKVEDLSLTEVSHLIRIASVAEHLKVVREAAKALSPGDDVTYHNVVCTVIAVRELHPKGLSCNMNNVTIQLPDGIKKTVEAKSLTKI